MKLGTHVPDGERRKPIDIEVCRSKVKVTLSIYMFATRLSHLWCVTDFDFDLYYRNSKQKKNYNINRKLKIVRMIDIYFYFFIEFSELPLKIFRSKFPYLKFVRILKPPSKQNIKRPLIFVV